MVVENKKSCGTTIVREDMNSTNGCTFDTRFEPGQFCALKAVIVLCARADASGLFVKCGWCHERCSSAVASRKYNKAGKSFARRWFRENI